MARFGGSVWLEMAGEAVASLRSQGRRSMLALLGVMIGSASIVALMSFAHIAKTEVMTRFQQVGVDTVQIIADETGQTWLDADLLQTALAQDRHVVTAAPMAVSRSQTSIGRFNEQVSVVAVSPEALDLLSLYPASGRALSSVDGCNSVAVLGAGLASASGARAGDIAYVDSYGLRVVGLLPPHEPQALNPVSPDETVFIGLGCAARLMPREGYSHVLIRVQPESDPSQWATDFQRRLGAEGQTISVRTPREMIAAMNSQMNLMSAILVAIGSVSLLVGGVGVMNVMLMSVMERRREIGLRAALGATPTEIIFIFMIEAVALSIGGGFLGAVAGVVLTGLGCAFLPIRFAFDPMVLVWGTGIAGGVGLVFGIHPAVSAAQILPVEALRAD